MYHPMAGRFEGLMKILFCSLRSNRLLYGEPKAYTGVGRPRIHGDKFKLNDSETW